MGKFSLKRKKLSSKRRKFSSKRKKLYSKRRKISSKRRKISSKRRNFGITDIYIRDPLKIIFNGIQNNDDVNTMFYNGLTLDDRYINILELDLKKHKSIPNYYYLNIKKYKTLDNPEPDYTKILHITKYYNGEFQIGYDTGIYNERILSSRMMFNEDNFRKLYKKIKKIDIIPPIQFI